MLVTPDCRDFDVLAAKVNMQHHIEAPVIHALASLLVWRIKGQQQSSTSAISHCSSQVLSVVVSLQVMMHMACGT